MNLEQSLLWLNKEIEKLKQENAEEKHIKTYEKFFCWLEELLRYRLFLSEFRAEIELSANCNFEQEWLLNFIDEEIEDWRLNDIIE